MALSGKMLNRPAENDWSRRRSAAHCLDLPKTRQQKAWRLHVLVIDVSDRYADHMRRKLLYRMPNIDLTNGIRAKRQ